MAFVGGDLCFRLSDKSPKLAMLSRKLMTSLVSYPVSVSTRIELVGAEVCSTEQCKPNSRVIGDCSARRAVK